MPNVPIVLRAQTSVGGLEIVLDGIPSRAHKLTTLIGGEPLEDGRQVTDHAVAAPRELNLNCIVSDFNGADRPKAAWQAMEALQQAAQPLSVITEWGVYPEMLILRARGNTAGRGLRGTLEMREIIRVGITGATVPGTAQSGPAAGRSAIVERGRVALPF